MIPAKVVEKIETHVLQSITFFSPKNRAVYEIMGKNTADRAGHR